MAAAARGKPGRSSAFCDAKVALQEGQFGEFSRLLQKYPAIAIEQGGSVFNSRTLLHYACTLAAVMEGDRAFQAIYSVPPTESYGDDVVYHPSIAALEMLITHGAVVNAREFDGATPLFVLANMMRRYSSRLSGAAKSVVAQMCTMLLQAGADPMLSEDPAWSIAPRSPYSMAKPGSSLRREYEDSPAMRAALPPVGIPLMAVMTFPMATPAIALPLVWFLNGEVGTVAAQQTLEQEAASAMVAMSWGRYSLGSATVPGGVATKAGGVTLESMRP